MKKTAVEWLIERIEDTSHDLHHLMKVRGVFDQAKEMEKEQMEDVWHDSRVEDFGDNYIGKQISFNDYYNETFNTKNQ